MKLIPMNLLLLHCRCERSRLGGRAWQSHPINMRLRSMFRAKRGISEFASAFPRNDTSLNALVLFRKKISALIAAVAIFLIGIIAVERTFAQAQIKEIPQEKKTNLSKQRKLEGSFEKNPFLLPSGIYLLSKGGSVSARKEEAAKTDTKFQEIDLLTVKAILISDTIQLAFIGWSIVTVGDRIDDERVLEIKPDRVILGKGDRRRTLLLHQSPVQLTTEEK